MPMSDSSEKRPRYGRSPMRPTMTPRSGLPEMNTWMPTKKVQAASNDAMAAPLSGPAGRSRRGELLAERGQQLAAVEEDLVRVDAPVAQLRGAHAVHLDHPVADRNRRVPLVEESVRQRQRSAVRPYPVRETRQQPGEIGEQRRATAHAGGYGGIGIERVVGVERHQEGGLI